MSTGHRQAVELKPVVIKQCRHRSRPALQVTTGLDGVTELDQQVHQLQTQSVIVRTGHQQQRGIVGRYRVRLTTIRVEYGFTLEYQQQQTAHSASHHCQHPGIEQADVLTHR
ncbi:hypothetical protein D3C78_760440 [compost metagenome]